MPPFDRRLVFAGAGVADCVADASIRPTPALCTIGKNPQTRTGTLLGVRGAAWATGALSTGAPNRLPGHKPAKGTWPAAADMPAAERLTSIVVRADGAYGSGRLHARRRVTDRRERVAARRPYASTMSSNPP